MDLDKAVEIIDLCVENTTTTVKEARIISDAWEQIKKQLFSKK